MRKSFVVIDIEEYNYPLNKNRIAAFPLEERDASNLLIYRNGVIHDRRFRELSEQLEKRDALVINNTKVIKARLHFKKNTGKVFEVFCLEAADEEDPVIALAREGQVDWKCMVRGAKRWGEEPLTMELRSKDGSKFAVKAERLVREGDSWIIRFSWDRSQVSFADILAWSGAVPIPPYFDREAVEEDELRYQTVYAAFQGSVAAPTAGLHFTERVFSELREKGIEVIELTLHVGAGTFKPVQTRDAREHDMHEEIISVSHESLQKLSSITGKIIAVGTTSMRTLESIYWMANRIAQKQSDAFNISQFEYEEQADRLKSLRDCWKMLSEAAAQSGQIHGRTGIMITPGYEFKVCDALITNFHQPKSTLLLLVSAFIGDDWRKIYDHALKKDYRFLSYGDSSLLFRN